MRRVLSLGLAAATALGGAIPASSLASAGETPTQTIADVRQNAIAFAMSDTTAKPATTISQSSCSTTVTQYKLLRGMAKSWRSTSDPTVRANLASKITTGFRYLQDTCYSQTKFLPNWHDNEIVIPQEVAFTTLLLHGSGLDLAPYIADALYWTNNRIDYHTGVNITGPGLQLILFGALAGDPTMVATGRDKMLESLRVTPSEGFNPDGGYAYHGVSYMAGYGTWVAQRFSVAAIVLGTSPWQFSDADFVFLFERLVDGFRLSTTADKFFEFTRGRQVTVMYGSTAVDNISTYLRRLRPWAGSRTAELDTWIDQLEGRSTATASAFKMFFNTDKAAWHNGEVSVGLSMHSARRRPYETLQGSNLEGWYVSEGMLELHDADRRQFEDHWFATVDRQRLPGTTVSRKRLSPLPCDPVKTTATWVGGVSLGEFGAAGQQLDPNLKSQIRSEHPVCPTTPVDLAVDLEAKKSWFFFDDEVVALGADIRSADPVNGAETIVENRKVNGTDVLVVNGTQVTPALGSTQTVDGAAWAHLTGDAGSSIGYVFPTPTSIQVKRETRTGAWSQIDSSPFTSPDGLGAKKTTPATRKFVSMAIDHGVRPTNGSYGYVLLPNSSAEETEAYAGSPGAVVLANNAVVQAAEDRSTGVMAANFWASAGGSVGGITVTAPASLAVRRVDDTMTFAVSDPTQRRSVPMRVTFDAPASSVVSLDPNITVVATTPELVLDVAPSAVKGATSTAVLTMSGGGLAANQPPVVDAGADKALDLLTGSSVTLTGSVSDDGLPGPVVSSWSVVSGPGPVVFGSPGSLSTTASFSVVGTYVVELAASDGELTGRDTATVTVTRTNVAPVVDAGADKALDLLTGSSVTLTGSVSDDGLPGPVVSSWSVVSGPGPVVFGSPGSLSTTASFSVVGTYVVELAASDGELTGRDTATVTVTKTARPTVALVAGSAKLPTGDVRLKQRLEATGFAVKVVDDDLLTRAALDGASVVVVSSSVTPTKVPTWLATAPVPVVNTEAYAHKRLGLATANGELAYQRELAIVAPSHPVAAGRSGRVVVSSATSFGWARPVRSAKVVATLAGRPTDAAIFTVERGAPLVSGSAAARRVGFHFGYGGPAAATANGWALFDAAVAWAKG